MQKEVQSITRNLTRPLTAQGHRVSTEFAEGLRVYTQGQKPPSPRYGQLVRNEAHLRGEIRSDRAEAEERVDRAEIGSKEEASGGENSDHMAYPIA